jgi:hypothetical protein
MPKTISRKNERKNLECSKVERNLLSNFLLRLNFSIVHKKELLIMQK